jgi:hypothetical protein
MTPGGTLLVRNADVLVTMEGQRREIRGGGLDGRVVVEDGRLGPVDLGSLVERHNRIARRLVAG